MGVGVDLDRTIRTAGGVALAADLLARWLARCLGVEHWALAPGHGGQLQAGPPVVWAAAAGRAQGSSSRVSAQLEQ
jgi:hypothetical protein